MTVKYLLLKSLMALTQDNVVTVIQAGSVVEAPATFARTGTIEVLSEGDWMRVLAIDLLDAGRIQEGDIE